MSWARLGCAWMLALCISGCTTTNVVPVDAERYRLGEVCIERNPRVFLPALLPAVRDAFRRNRVTTVVRGAEDLEDCETVLRYTAVRGTGMTGAYTKAVDLELWRGETSIGRVSYEHSGGVAITKYVRTADKLDPLIDRLLEGQRPRR